MGRHLAQVVAAVALVSATGAVHADRMLLVEGDTRALLSGTHICGQPVTVVVESGRPELFQSDTMQLERILDGVRAMLAFECPGLREIEVQGRLTGMATTLYRGLATQASGWRLDALESIRAQEDTAAPAVADAPVPESGGFAVAGLDTGMTVDEAMAAVSQAFGGDPAYDPARGLMAFEAGGCPPGYDPAGEDVSPVAGWKCLRGWFSHDSLPRLARFELVQVTEHASADEVAGLLEDRFGPPGARWLETRDNGGLWGGEREVVYLAWGGVVSTSGQQGERPRPAYELEAAVERIEGLAVTTLTRSAGDAAQGGAAPPGPGRSDLRL